MKKRILTLFLAFLMLIGLMPLPSFAESEDAVDSQSGEVYAADELTQPEAQPIDIPACPGEPICWGSAKALPLNEHQDSTCTRKEYLKTFVAANTAESIAALWVGFTAAEQADIVVMVETYAAGYEEEFKALVGLSAEQEETEDNSEEKIGIEVYGEDLPEDLRLSISDADASAELELFGLEEAVFALDIKMLNEDSSECQPDSALLVKIPVDAAAGTKIGLLHTHEGKTSYMGITEVLSDGTVEFYTDSFSEFAGFTVDFHYEGVAFSLDGESSLLLSQLFGALGIPHDAATADSVVFSNPSLLAVERQATGDWLLSSLKTFNTQETLIITFEDGTVMLIDVTDPIHTYLSFGNSDVDGHFSHGVYGAKKFRVHLYLGDNTASFDSSNQVSAVPADAWLDLTSNTYWFEIKDVSGGAKIANKPYDPILNVLDKLNEHSVAFAQENLFKSEVDVHVKCWPRTITDSGNSIYCYVKQAPKFVKSGDTTKRNVEIYLNRNGSFVQVQSFSDILFPDRNGDVNGHDSINAGLDLSTPTGAPGYKYVRREDDGNKTYRVYIELIPYTLSYELNGGNLTNANPGSYNVESAAFTLNNPSRTGYTFAGWTGTGLSSASKNVTVAAGSIGDRSYTANWTALNYALSFNYNGGMDNNGSAADRNYEATYDNSNYYDVSWLNPIRPGYKFEGWYTQPEGGTQVYDANGICITGSYWNSGRQWVGTSDLSLYAHWTEQYRYVLNFDANGGENAPGTLTADWSENTSHTFTWTHVPSRDGYSFMGWAESSGSTENVTGQSKSSYTIPGSAAQTVERTLYAIWERDTGTLKLDHQGAVPAIVTVQGEGLNITLVLDKDIIISDLPTGSYTVSASGASASATVTVDEASPVIALGSTTAVKITVSSRNISWFTGFSRVVNSYGG